MRELIMIKHIESADQFNKEIASGKVLVDFYATWCGPCQMLSPVIEQLDKEANIKILKVDVDELSDIARVFRVMSIPTLVVLENGKMTKREMGYMPLERLKQLIS